MFVAGSFEVRLLVFVGCLDHSCGRLPAPQCNINIPVSGANEGILDHNWQQTVQRFSPGLGWVGGGENGEREGSPVGSPSTAALARVKEGLLRTVPGRKEWERCTQGYCGVVGFATSY